jgi:mannose-6-phosphate isomerase-like protein (cupin superfamily)
MHKLFKGKSKVNPMGVERIERDGKILAIIARAALIDNLEGMSFVSPDEFPFQVGFHSRKQGEVIKPHEHIPFAELKDFPVQEFFYVVSGSVKIDLYENDLKVEEVTVTKGDSIILNTGHGFTFINDAKLLELKQGPYRGRENEKRFIP